MSLFPKFVSQPAGYWRSTDQFMERRKRVPMVEDKPLADDRPAEYFGFKKTDLHTVAQKKSGPFLDWDGEQHPFATVDENEPEKEQWEITIEERLQSLQQTGAGRQSRQKRSEREGSDEPVPCWAMLPSSEVLLEQEVRQA
jgi:hypothetical protein